jgi:hypothetical protein
MTQRTQTQNKALHKYFTQLANELDAHGIDQKMLLDKLQGYSVPITKDFLKDVWKAVQKRMYQKESTTELSTSQVSEVYETVNRFTAQEFGVHTAFPSNEEIMLKYIGEETNNIPATKEVMGGVQENNQS